MEQSALRLAEINREFPTVLNSNRAITIGPFVAQRNSYSQRYETANHSHVRNFAHTVNYNRSQLTITDYTEHTNTNCVRISVEKYV